VGVAVAGHVLRSPGGHDATATGARLGPSSMSQSAAAITSRLCSITTTVFPASTSFWSTSTSRWTSGPLSPVVGSSMM
jgi:hypothetical protein